MKNNELKNIFPYNEFYIIRDEVYNKSDNTIRTTKKTIKNLYSHKDEEEKNNIKSILQDIIGIKDTSPIMDRTFLLIAIIMPCVYSLLEIFISLYKDSKLETVFLRNSLLFVSFYSGVFLVWQLCKNLNRVVKENIEIKNNYRIAKLYLDTIREIEANEKF